MIKKIGKNRLRFFIVTACITVLTTGFAYSKPKSELVKEEPGYYYGNGKGSTAEDAAFLAKRELVENALTATVRLTNPAAQKVTVSDSVVNARFPDLKPYQASKDGKTVTYRMKHADWEKHEKAYSDKLRQTLNSSYEKFNSQKNSAEKLSIGAKILSTLAENGETELLTLQEKGTELFSKKVESACSNIVQNLEFVFSESDKIITSSNPIVITAKDSSGSALAGLSVKLVWEVPVISGASESADIAEVVSIVKTDAIGNVTAEYPVSDDYKNKIVCLTVSTAFASEDYVTSAMRKLDGASSADARYYCVEDINSAYKTVEVAAGKYTTGAMKADSRASAREASREVELADYAVDVSPVTNFQYAAYLYLTRADSTPEYLDNTDFNAPSQPIINISAAEAEAYAAWLSEQTGSKYRLPTDDEWEVAARAGAEVIYPWGDEAPNKGKKANYKKNGKFKFTSPVGAFEENVNAWGLVDMAGNVWEWTSSARNEAEDSTLRTVKGGSWMDGPVDLRISNYKNVDGNNGYTDVGFRLVKEISK
ncbi:formylglycine-generating enzyme family protein [Treponema sp.]|uniref:formylglycine-generating enzyme family protein n=1 Tax=Treponema sp. TaxID=166 RepID=UPI00388EF2F0